MKRGRPLERRTRLKSNKRLDANPDKVREFLRRAKPLERSEFRSNPKPRRPPEGVTEGPLTPAEWRAAAFAASGGRCVMTGATARNVDDRRFHAHHPLGKRLLRARGLFGYVYDPRNALWLRRDAHVRHEDAIERVPAEKLPGSVWLFCAELDALDGTEWATFAVLRAHPPAGSSRTLS